ncbi:MAG: hypothetical protein JW841_08280 [Deltaproteobacteria bacterium]|nr:hypothetical protein [Deltaproteobacteria bacterium]
MQHSEQEQEIEELKGIDLSALDLSDIDIDEHPSEAWRWVGLIILASAMGVILWIPNTDWFRLLGENSTISFILAGIGIFVGILLGRWLWLWGLAAAERYAARAAKLQNKEQKPPSALQRWLTLIVVLGGAGAILYVPASSYYQQGSNYGAGWFLAAGGAVAIGIVLGRWLLMQASAKRISSTKSYNITLPPWFKWVTLSIISITVIVVLVGKLLSGGNDPGSFDFSFGIVGFIAGVSGAIWLAKRFDEWEKRHKTKSRRRQKKSPLY